MGILDEFSLDDRTIDIASIEIAHQQVRTEKVGETLEELAANIKTVGQLAPIIVAQLGPDPDANRWSLLAGQRRYLAMKSHLKAEKIRAICILQEVDENQARIISASENFLQEKMTGDDWRLTCNKLWDVYGTWKKIEEKTGLPVKLIKRYVKGARLCDALKEKEMAGAPVDLLIRIQDATDDKGVPDEKKAVELYDELVKVDDATATKAIKYASEHRIASVKKVVEEAEKPDADKVTINRMVFEGTYCKKMKDHTEEGGFGTPTDAAWDILATFLDDNAQEE